jgi:hypothetical protein
MDQPPYTHQPEAGVPIRRLISAPNLSGSYSDRAIKSELSDNKRLERLGFTKYERTGKGVMEAGRANLGPADSRRKVLSLPKNRTHWQLTT